MRDTERRTDRTARGLVIATLALGLALAASAAPAGWHAADEAPAYRVAAR